MGCFNGTCSLSNLPIFAGEKIVLIPLIRTIGEMRFHCCNATDNFTPLGFPIIGEYNDYGGIENAVTDKNNKEFLYNFSYFYEERDTGECAGYIEVKLSDNFDDFLNETFCCDGAYVQTNDFNFHPNGLKQISFMMIHYDLYEKIINEIANRIPWGKNRIYKELCYNEKLSYLKEQWKVIEQLNELEKIPTKDEILLSCIEISKHSSIHSISNKIFCNESYINCGGWTWLSEVLLFKKEDWTTVLEKAVENLIFTVALNYMRKGYLSDSGAGSQSGETRLHIILADFIKEHVKNYAIAFNEEVIDEEEKSDENGTAEFVF